jgi:hypothetical protein
VKVDQTFALRVAAHHRNLSPSLIASANANALYVSCGIEVLFNCAHTPASLTRNSADGTAARERQANMVRAPSPTPSPPSTPDYHRPASRDAHPSTTPAGPPPDRSFIASSTPAGPPPATDLFSSQFQTSFNPRAFNLNKTGPNSSPPKSVLFGAGEASYGTSAPGRPGSHRGRFTSANNARIPSSPPGADMEEEDTEDGEDGEEDEDMGEHEDGEETGEDDEDMDEGEYDDEGDDEVDDLAQVRGRPNNRMSQSFMSQNSVAPQLLGPPIVRPDASQSQYDLLSLAKGLAPRPERVDLREPDKIILETERFLEKLHVALTDGPREKRSDALGEATQELLAAWQSASQPSLLTSMFASLRSKGSSPLAQAHRLASLLLQIHHPRHVAQPQRPTALSLKSTHSNPRSYTPIPKVLLDWLNTHHNAISEVPAVMAEPNGCSAHRNFWDAILASAFLGDFGDTVKLLRRANFSVAETASIDNPGASGYTGVHLDNAEWAARGAIGLLEECPALSMEDWDVKGHDWSIFRQRVSQTLKELQEFAEGESQNRLGLSQSFQTSHFGIPQSQNSFNLSVASRKAESKVPWTVYDNLCRLYKQLLGNEEDLIEISADWIEAVIGLTVWWNGDEEDVPQGSLAASRRSIVRSQRIRTVDVTPVKAYCQRLSSALATMFETDEEDFSLNTTDRAAVGLACIFDGNVEGALQIISSWSLTVASSVAEVASGGDWFRQADSIMDQFDNGDLMLLSYNDARPAGATKDDLLIAYADALARKATIRSPASKTEQEGWELAIRVLGRLDDDNLSKTKIEQILNELSLENPDRVDKITQLCYGMNLSEQAQHIALVSNSSPNALPNTILTNSEIRRTPPPQHTKLRRHTLILRPRPRRGQNPRNPPRPRRPLPCQIHLLPSPRRPRHLTQIPHPLSQTNTHQTGYFRPRGRPHALQPPLRLRHDPQILRSARRRDPRQRLS